MGLDGDGISIAVVDSAAGNHGDCPTGKSRGNTRAFTQQSFTYESVNDYDRQGDGANRRALWNDQAEARSFTIHVGDLAYARSIGRADLRTDPSALSLCDPVLVSEGPGVVGADVDLSAAPSPAYVLVTGTNAAGEGILGTGSGGLLRGVDAAACP